MLQLLMFLGLCFHSETEVSFAQRISEEYWGHRVDIRIVEPESFPYALLYFTGSQRFNILCRQRALALGMVLNEYGLYLKNKPILASSEAEIFSLLKIRYLEPQERTRNLDHLDPY